MEEVVPKMAHRYAQMQDNSEGSEVNSAVDVHKHCKKNSPSFYAA